MARENSSQKGKAEAGAVSTQGMQKVHAGRVPAPFDEMDRLFERMLPGNWLRPMHWEWPTWAEHRMPFEGKTPHIDIIDR